MDLVCMGISHKTAPLEVREKLALSEEEISKVLQRVSGTVAETMVVSTCNRVEFYAVAESAEKAKGALHSVVASLGGDRSLEHLYQHHGDSALVHLFRVTASLDSMVVGEAQILGQVKDALELAQRVGAAGPELIRACAAAFASAKRVRSETGIGRSAVSMASAAVELANKVFGGLEGRSALLVGAGEMGELAGKHLRNARAAPIIVINRTRERAEHLASSIGGEVRDFEDLHSAMILADLVVCSTASPKYIFTKESITPILRIRKFRPLFMVDLAVPRDIAPDLSELEGVYAYDVDDIQRVIADNSAARAVEAAKAETIIAEEIARFVRSRSIRDGVPVLALLRARAEQIAKAEAERTLANLGGDLSEKQRRSVQAMATAIINKLLHEPTSRLRELGADQSANRLADAAAELFGLESGSPNLEDQPAAPAPELPAAMASRGSKR
ncbi:MAG TPA: glutamyl-tRNA reductase [Myxococcaceae bacterium]|nr:glutamyl-tRNA reductase [Myxococcaceae bacterium]